MATLTNDPVASVLAELHRQAEATDRPLVDEMIATMQAQGETLEDATTRLVAEEGQDYRAVYRDHAGHFLAITPAFGGFLYAVARACRATRIVEFGTSMGVSTIYLAAALRDNGGGRLVGSELEPSKAARARAHLETAGLADLTEIREGDARETLRDVGGDVDLALIDGAWSLYLPILKLIEPQLRLGAVIIGENAFAREYLDHVRDPANGYFSQPLPIDEGRGNEFTVKIH